MPSLKNAPTAVKKNTADLKHHHLFEKLVEHYLVLPLFSLVGPIFVGPKYKKKPNSVYIFVFTTNQIYSTWN